VSLYALDDVPDAVEATRALLLPVDRGRWLRLALVVFFVGGGGVTGQLSNGVSQGSSDPASSAGGVPSLDGPDLLLVGGLVAAAVVVVLALLFVGAVMEFVLVESLRRETVTVRRYWRDHWRRGARLFGFRAALGLATLALAGGVLAVALAPGLLGVGAASAVLLLLAVPVALAVLVVSALVGGFTTAFVVPVMLAEDRGVVAAWRRFWPVLSGAWRQYLAYAAASFVLRLGLGLLTTVVTLLAAVVLAVPLGLVAAVGLALALVVGGVGSPVGWAVVALAAVVFVLSLVAVSLLAAVPVRTFLRYYALFVLGDTAEPFDLVAERRRAVRSG
jgi:hypothetical protein